MPYKGELANKASHFDVVKNPDIQDFLAECDVIKEPSEHEAEVACARFVVPPPFDDTLLPEQVVAIDGSPALSQVRDNLPSTEIGYVKIGCVLIDMTEFHSLRENGLVDPFRVATLERNNDTLSFALPMANVYWRDTRTLSESFRARIDYLMHATSTRFVPDDPSTSLRTTLFHLASKRAGNMGTGNVNKLSVHKCPVCKVDGPYILDNSEHEQRCPNCEAILYPSDCLRLWEDVSEYGASQQVLSRFMLQIEHLLPMHYIRYLFNVSPNSLSGLVFFIDGPLAIYGTGAWLHSSIMSYLAEINAALTAMKLEPVQIIGLQKTGQVRDHVKLLDPFLPKNRICAVDDGYRYSVIKQREEGRSTGNIGFGAETYYGQDFIYKTPTGRTFVFALPYPFSSKSDTPDFSQVKVDLSQYAGLARALELIQHFESDLYEDAVIPIALAHRYTAISLEPGGKVLDLLLRNAMESWRQSR